MGNVATAAYGTAFLGGVLAWILLLAGVGERSAQTFGLSLQRAHGLHTNGATMDIPDAQALG